METSIQKQYSVLFYRAQPSASMGSGQPNELQRPMLAQKIPDWPIRIYVAPQRECRPLIQDRRPGTVYCKYQPTAEDGIMAISYARAAR